MSEKHFCGFESRKRDVPFDETLLFYRNGLYHNFTRLSNLCGGEKGRRNACPVFQFVSAGEQH